MICLIATNTVTLTAYTLHQLAPNAFIPIFRNSSANAILDAVYLMLVNVLSQVGGSGISGRVHPSIDRIPKTYVCLTSELRSQKTQQSPRAPARETSGQTHKLFADEWWRSRLMNGWCAAVYAALKLGNHIIDERKPHIYITNTHTCAEQYAI